MLPWHKTLLSPLPHHNTTLPVNIHMRLTQGNLTLGACYNVWLKFKDISLCDQDQKILEEGGMLIDKHINFAQRLLKHLFPNIHSLQLTLLQDKNHKEPTTNRIQVLHVNKNHWACAASMASKENEVNVYDSTYSNWDHVC